MTGIRELVKRLSPKRSQTRKRELAPARLDPDVQLAPGFASDLLLARGPSAAPYPVLYDPGSVAAASLDAPGDEPVIGIEVAGEARAYPLAVMRLAHIANDRVASRPVMVTFCVRCFSGVGFDPVIDGARLTFHVFGAYRGAFAMRDDQTGTVWSELSGEALAGQLAGRRLPLLATEITTLSEWLERFPDSLAPDVPIDGARRPERELPPDSAPWWRSVPHRDKRLPLGSLVLGVEIDGEARAYPIDAAINGPLLIQDELAGVPVALVAKPGALPLAYERRVGATVLDLRLVDGRIIDQRGAEWSGRGLSAAGEDGITQLPLIPSQIVQWYAWAAHHPDSGIGASSRSR